MALALDKESAHAFMVACGNREVNLLVAQLNARKLGITFNCQECFHRLGVIGRCVKTPRRQGLGKTWCYLAPERPHVHAKHSSPTATVRWARTLKCKAIARHAVSIGMPQRWTHR